MSTTTTGAWVIGIITGTARIGIQAGDSIPGMVPDGAGDSTMAGDGTPGMAAGAETRITAASMAATLTTMATPTIIREVQEAMSALADVILPDASILQV